MSCYPKKDCNSNDCNSSDSVFYTGEFLSCTGIECGDTLSVVLQKLDEKYCEIFGLLQNCNTTTSTTTSTTTVFVDVCQSPFMSLFPLPCNGINPLTCILQNAQKLIVQTTTTTTTQ